MLNQEYIFTSKYSATDCCDGKEVSLAQVLDARDCRKKLQDDYLISSETVISLTLVAPGAIKRNLLLDYTFTRAVSLIENILNSLKILSIKDEIKVDETGHYAIWGVNYPAEELKLACIKLEESTSLARIFDIDIIDKKGNILSRSDFSRQDRQCIICDKVAKFCARARTHSIAELNAKIKTLVIKDDFILHIGDLVYYSLFEEVNLTPKPGLVDSCDTGAHTDMDLNDFHESAYVLKSFFYQFVEVGITYADQRPDELLYNLRRVGIKAEEAMFNTTQGVNTHKGAIFSFGLICGAIGYLYANNLKISIQKICGLVSLITKNITKELTDANIPETAGIRLFKQYNYTGARGEAASGFSTIRQYGLENNLSELSKEHVLLIILLRFCAYNNDTNILKRGGPEGLAWFQAYAKELLDNSNILFHNLSLKQRLIEFNQECIKRNLSPGGSADLLAITIFLLKLSNNNKY